MSATPARPDAHGCSPGARSGPPHEAPGGLLMHAARSFRRHTAEALAPWEISPHQARALRVITTHGPVRSATLAQWLHIAPRSATEVIDALVERGLVQRHPDPQDRRAVLVQITAAGADLRRELDAARRAAAQTFFARLEESEQQTLATLLAKVLDD